MTRAMYVNPGHPCDDPCDVMIVYHASDRKTAQEIRDTVCNVLPGVTCKLHDEDLGIHPGSPHQRLPFETVATLDTTSQINTSAVLYFLLISEIAIEDPIWDLHKDALIQQSISPSSQLRFVPVFIKSKSEFANLPYGLFAYSGLTVGSRSFERTAKRMLESEDHKIMKEAVKRMQNEKRTLWLKRESERKSLELKIATKTKSTEKALCKSVPNFQTQANPKPALRIVIDGKELELNKFQDKNDKDSGAQKEEKKSQRAEFSEIEGGNSSDCFCDLDLKEDYVHVQINSEGILTEEIAPQNNPTEDIAPQNNATDDITPKNNPTEDIAPENNATENIVAEHNSTEDITPEDTENRSSAIPSYLLDYMTRLQSLVGQCSHQSETKNVYNITITNPKHVTIQ